MHSPKRALIVRLACLRHAASVDSEPGSNSRSFPSSSFWMPIITYRTFCCSYELTHGHAYLVFKYQLLFASLPVRGETIDYTERVLYVKRLSKSFNFFFRTRRTGVLRAIYDSLRFDLTCQATSASLKSVVQTRLELAAYGWIKTIRFSWSKIGCRYFFENKSLQFLEGNLFNFPKNRARFSEQRES